MFLMRWPMSSDLSDFSMLPRKMPRNHSSEYWYMGSTLASDVVQKNSSCVRTDTGMFMRVVSMSFSVTCAASTLAWISPDLTLDASRASIRFLVVSWAALGLAQQVQDRVFTRSPPARALLTIRALLAYSRSGRSRATTRPSIWSSRPLGDSVKLIMVTLVDTSGVYARRVGQLRGDVEAEVVVVRDDRVAQLDHGRARLLEGLPQ
jgi:hypothetical protein